MSSDRKHAKSNSIPIRFFDGDEVSEIENEAQSGDFAGQDSGVMTTDEPLDETADARRTAPDTGSLSGQISPELIAARGEIKRLQAELTEALDAIARRQADFENYRKRIERERGEAYTRIVADVARSLLPVLDNFGRALDAERSVEAS